MIHGGDESDESSEDELPVIAAKVGIWGGEVIVRENCHDIQTQTYGDVIFLQLFSRI